MKLATDAILAAIGRGFLARRPSYQALLAGSPIRLVDPLAELMEAASSPGSAERDDALRRLELLGLDARPPS